jgi:hypothetical protein
MKVFLFVIVLATTSFSKKNTVLKGEVNVGISQPLGYLALIIEPGVIYQTHFFGGVKVKGGAAGFGVDFSFADYTIAHGEAGHYRRFTTDFLFFPLNGKLISITPGINISMSDVKLNEYGISEFSIRPSFLIQTGFHLPIHKQITLNLNYRYEYVIGDEEFSISQDEHVNISGQFGAILGGIEVSF